MGYITKSRLDNVTTNRTKSFSKGLSAPAILNESYNPNKQYDIFLSHSYLDKERIASLKLILEYYGFSVYVDWISDADLNRNNVNRETAARIRHRMKNCKSLLYAISNNSVVSKWMPWELGYFDGVNGKIALVPITESNDEYLRGSEYLELYPVVKEYLIKGSDKNALWVYESEFSNSYVILDAWINYDKKPYFH